MSLTVTAVIFVILWVLTFVPAWYLAIKIAITIKRKPINPAKIFLLFVVYEAIIILPYITIFWGINRKSDVISALVLAIIILICAVETVRVLDIDRLKDILWTVYSYCYDSLLHFYPYQELINDISIRAEKYIKKGSKIADIGSGTGNLSYEILGDTESVELYEVEPNLQMLKRSRKKLNGLETGSVIKYVNKNAVDYLLSIPDNSLDVVLMSNVLYAVSDRGNFWRLLSKKLNKDGVAIISNSDRSGSKWLIKYHLQHASPYQLIRPSLLAVGIIDDFINQLSEGNYFEFTSQSELDKEIREAKLNMIDVKRCYGGEKHGVNLLFTVC